jgi:DNA-binding MarR family transcriptional regulator
VAAGRLAEETGLTTGAITTVLDRLERAGYARRGEGREHNEREAARLETRLRAEPDA